MPEPFAIEGFAIVTADGMIADANGVMPDTLKYDADQQWLSAALDQVDLILQGKHSHEGHPNSASRRRFWLTHSVKSLASKADAANEWLWNPAGIELSAACRAIGLEGGAIAVLGGPSVYDLFLPRYSAFNLSRAGKIMLPGGTPVFSHAGENSKVEDVLSAAGLVAEAPRMLDADNEVTVTRWVRK